MSDGNDLTLDQVREACALACEALAEVTMLGRDTRNQRNTGRLRRGAFFNAADVIRQLKPEDLRCLLASVAACPSAAAPDATTKATPNGFAARIGGSSPASADAPGLVYVGSFGKDETPAGSAPTGSGDA